MSDMVGWAFPIALLTPVVLIEVGEFHPAGTPIGLGLFDPLPR